jgi:vacuolar protein sorting-associated protein 13A/C
MFEKYL